MLSFETEERVLHLLESIAADMKVLAAAVKVRQASAPKQVATDRDLDGKYGDPVLKFKVRDWTGPSYKGRKFSECPAELLDLIAESLEYFGRQADEKKEVTDKGRPVGDFKRQDAARARGWAARIRAGKQAAPANPPSTRTPAAAAAPATDGLGASEWDDDETPAPVNADDINW